MFTTVPTLQDEHVALEPMALKHTGPLYKAGQALSIWKWTSHNYCKSELATETWVERCLSNKEIGVQIPFVVIDKFQNQVVGSSSFLNIAKEHKTIEVGYTFLHPSVQKSYVNKCSKLLLLSYAFETLNYNRVALQTHEQNKQSRAAILSIGAQFEGVNRYARIQQDGSIRNSAIYSIIEPDWQAVKADLQAKVTIKQYKRNKHVHS
ncbi:MAG: GNAT family protein [Paraglaciecola sp.]|uniref:GNAT family N-acetyltransferase n=1 Tax=Paraglaciecola sp. TaxID=1920173 RepID=UPI0032655513